MIKNFIFLGNPGVGKGTLAKKLSYNKGLIHISTGEIFREEIKQNTKLGIQIKKIVENGEYVPDEITNKIVKKNLLKEKVIKNGFILDGYPRTINQAQFLKDNNFQIDVVFFLKANNEIIQSRILNRNGLRKDDNPSIIQKRIDIYNNQTKPLINWYKNKKLLNEIDVSGSIEQNYQILIKEIK